MMGMFAGFSRWKASMEKTSGGLAHADSERLAQVETQAAEVFEEQGQADFVAVIPQYRSRGEITSLDLQYRPWGYPRATAIACH